MKMLLRVFSAGFDRAKILPYVVTARAVATLTP